MTSIDKNLWDQVFASGDSADSKQASQQSKHASPPRREELTDSSATTSAQIENEIIELLNRHSSALGRYALSLAKDGTLAQDAIQEVFLRYFKTRSSGQCVENPRAWLFHVLRNYVLNCIQKNSFMQPAELDAAGNIADIKQDVEAAYARNETFRLAVSALSPRERECVQLRLEGFSNREIARILHIRSSNVTALLARSLNKIRKTGIFSGRK